MSDLAVKREQGEVEGRNWNPAEYRRIAFDVESYPDWFLACFVGERADGTTDVLTLESMGGKSLSDDERRVLIHTMREARCLVSFNGTSYDLPMLMVMAQGEDARRVNAESNTIVSGARSKPRFLSKDPERHVDCERLIVGMRGLKELAAMLHMDDIGELPLDPFKRVGDDPQAIRTLREYCESDCRRTLKLHDKLLPAVELRRALNEVYELDDYRRGGFAFALESQIGEWIIDAKCGSKDRRKRDRGDYRPTRFKWAPPDYIQFDDERCADLLEKYAQVEISAAANGSVSLPEELAQETKTFEFAGTEFKLGIGGMHTKQPDPIHLTATPGEFEIRDYDVASYYPSILLRNGSEPAKGFSEAYQELVDRRLAAKREGRAHEAQGLKIAVNGLFGKLKQPGSAVYSPETFFDVTATGQFALMMLVEDLAQAGATVLSANTDGVIVAVDPREADLDAGPIKRWQEETGFTLERTDYSVLAMRDVNNYVCIGTDGKVKAKGAYGRRELATRPAFDISAEAARLWLADGIPPEQTVEECQDLRKFLCVTKIKGGQAFNEKRESQGSVIRYYKSTDPNARLVVDRQGDVRLVPDGERARSVPTLEGDPPALPDDLDIDFYVNKAHVMIEELGDMSLSKTRTNSQSDMFDLGI